MNLRLLKLLDLHKYVLGAFGFTEMNYYLSTKPEKAVGEDDLWHKAEDSLIKALKSENLKYEVDEGGGAFYGPKIDIKIKDALGT